VFGYIYEYAKIPCYTGDAAVSACLVRTVQHIFQFTAFVNTLFLLISCLTSSNPSDYYHSLLNAEMFVRNAG
jgi:hypothetical protein